MKRANRFEILNQRLLQPNGNRLQIEGIINETLNVRAFILLDVGFIVA